MKLNIFKLSSDSIIALTSELEDFGYSCEYEHNDSHCYSALYLLKKTSQAQSWLSFYNEVVENDILNKYLQNLNSESLSGVFLIETEAYTYAVSHGQAHFAVRKYCDKDFGLDLAERIIDPIGLKMKHSQTFTSTGKKDITSFSNQRDIDASHEYGEAFNYVKCKTIDKALWGDSVDFGESARFCFGKNHSIKPTTLHKLADRIETCLKKPSVIKLPRYRKVTDKSLLSTLDQEFNQHFMDFLTEVDVDDYWLTGVSFNFSNDYNYSLKFHRKPLSGILDSLNATAIREIISQNMEIINNDFKSIMVVFYDENEDAQFSRPLQSLMQVTIEHESKYYVFYHGGWVEFSDSYVDFIKEQVDSIPFEIKDSAGKNETKLIDDLVSTGNYVQLHKDNVYIGKYCIEKADLMDENTVIMIKDQHQQADLVYLVKQATSSIRLSSSSDLGDNVFRGHNVCLWMLVNRKELKKLSDFKSFHLLDALNDFKREVTSKNLTATIWISLKK